jgi:hypothetical protein
VTPDPQEAGGGEYRSGMTAKPSYLGLLNAVAVAERDAGQYLATWAEVTTRPDVRAVIRTIALREAEHGLAFEKRLDELGYGVLDRRDPKHERRMKIAASTKLSDREKFERLGLGRAPCAGEPDVFDRFFENKDLDPVTGGLLGRYIAEERDSLRRFAECYAALTADSPAATKAKSKAKAKPATTDAKVKRGSPAKADRKRTAKA